MIKLSWILFWMIKKNKAFKDFKEHNNIPHNVIKSTVVDMTRNNQKISGLYT